MSVGAVIGLPPEQQFPDWTALIRLLAARLKAEGKADAATAVEAKLPDAMAAAQLAVDNLGRPRFLQEMELAFDRPHPPKANLSAVQAIWRLQPPFVITTNYDRVLEWPWEPTPVKRIFNDDPSPLAMLEDTSFTKPRVWHLHGSIERVDTLILTKDQYLTLYPAGEKKRTDYQNAFNQFQHLLTTRSFLFLGFSLTEPVLREKLEEVLSLTGRAAPIKFLLLHAGEADAARQKDLFDRFHVQVIEFAEFGDPMIAAIDAIGRAAWPNAPSIGEWGLTTVMRPLVEDLLDAVSGFVLTPEVIARAYNATKPRAWTHALSGGDGVTLLRDAILQLGGAVNSTQNTPPPLLDFVNRLKANATEPWLTRLTAWLDGAVERLGANEGARQDIRTLLAATRDSAARQRVQVLVRIRSDSAASDQWRVHAWSWTGTQMPETLFGAEGKSFKEGSSEDVVYALIDELETREFEADLTSIAFIVPSALAIQSIHAWRLSTKVANDPPIGAKYTVTVRPLERMDKPPMIRRRLKKAWDAFKERATEMLAVLGPGAAPNPKGVNAVLLDASAIMSGDLASNLENQGAHCVVLREPPSATTLGQLGVVFDTTTPAIVWSRDSTAPPADVEQAIRDLLQSVPIADLPRSLRDARRAGYRDKTGTHTGMNLTLIWDDADYVPPEHDPNARARLETI